MVGVAFHPSFLAHQPSLHHSVSAKALQPSAAAPLRPTTLRKSLATPPLATSPATPAGRPLSARREPRPLPLQSALMAAVLLAAAAAIALWLRRKWSPRRPLPDGDTVAMALMAASGNKEGSSSMLPRPASPESPQQAPTPEGPPSPSPPEGELLDVSVAEDALPSPSRSPKDKPLLDPADVFRFLRGTPVGLGLELGWKVRDWLRRLVERLSRPTMRDFVDGDDDVAGGLGCVVLVFGASTPIGRTLVRKLLLRGYAVRVLLLPSEVDGPLDLPASKQLEKLAVDFQDKKALQQAVTGVGKIICCASTPTPLDLQMRLLVDEVGIRVLCQAAQDVRNACRERLAEEGGKTAVTTPPKRTISKMRTLERWGDVKLIQRQIDNLPSKWASLVFDGAASFAPSEPDRPERVAVFAGEFQANREAVAEVTLPFEGDELDAVLRSEVLLLKLRGDGNRYTVAVTLDGRRYATAFTSVPRWQSVRIPLEALLDSAGQPIPRLAGQGKTGSLTIGFSTIRAVTAVTATGRITFKLDLQFIKAIPSGAEPDFVLVSQSSNSLLQGMLGGDLALLQTKGEAAVRKAGLSYTIIRPVAVLDAPSGGRPLLFDQARRGTSAVSAADVADLCVQVLHCPAACNKAFDVSAAD
eukprot:EG_transcript_5798